MKLFLPETKIGDLDGFTPENDIFGRKVIGDGLSHLIANVTDPLVVALDAPWGAGKTTFLKQWAGELRKAGFPVVFFDAFRHDHTDDAFAAIAGEIYALAQATKKENTPRGREYLESATRLSLAAAPSLARLAIKLGTLGVVDTKEEAKAIGEELAALGDKYARELIAGHTERQKTLDEFRAALSKLSSDLRGDEGAGEHRPLVLIIDELDRCRPVFALQLLERIKHFFSVPNVHFVLGANLSQVRNSIVAAYGVGIDAGTYLHKFIHLTTSLRETGEYERDLSTRRYIAHLKVALELPQAPMLDECLGLIRFVSETRHFSLRTVERIILDFTRAWAVTPPNRLVPPAILTGLCILRVTDDDLYLACVRGDAGTDLVMKALCLDRPTTREHELHYELEDARQWWAVCTGAGSDEEQASVRRQIGRIPTTQIIPWCIRSAVERLAPTR